METFAEGQTLEPQTFGDNTVYMEQFSEDASKHMRSGYIERHGHIIQIDWGKNGEEFTDEDKAALEFTPEGCQDFQGRGPQTRPVW